MKSVSPALAERLVRAAHSPVLLVACDFDGTLSAIAERPDLARADRRAVSCLAALSRLPHTHGAILSGRSLQDLRVRLGGLGAELERVRLIGSHGLESGEGNHELVLNPGAKARLDEIRDRVQDIAARAPGSIVEIKPASITFHYRQCEPEIGDLAARAVAELGEQAPGVFRLGALAAVELCVIEPNKGAALTLVRRRVGATGTVFIGDDVTDEAAFAVMSGSDLSIKVGSDSTRAAERVASQLHVAACLEMLHEHRRAWLTQRRPVGIEQHAILSDQRTAALVRPDGGVAWLCLPRLDSPAMFASLLGAEEHGVFQIRPIGEERPAAVEYEPDSLVLRTRWTNLTVTDYLDCAQGRAYQRAGRTDLVRVVEGSGEAVVKFAPRLDFGRVATRLVLREDGIEIEGWHDPVVLYAPGVSWRLEPEGDHVSAVAAFTAKEPVTFELRYGTASLRPNPITERVRREQNTRFWAGWTTSLRGTELAPTLVRRSAVTLKALVHGPSGSLAAAATTSLPEHVGGVRNWDYRYCWPRDACMAAAALVRLGNTGVAMKLLDWMSGVVQRCESPDRLRPIYSLLGEELGAEAEIAELPGYGESKPVRVGNAAAMQVQLDVFGPIVDLAAMLAERGVPITPEHWRLVEAMVRAVEARWMEPDHGIWEIRAPKRHHVHSKLMCWLAASRGVVVSELALGRDRPDWARLRDEIRADLLGKGWNPTRGVFTGVYGGDLLDAATLQLATTGFLSGDDARLRSTVELIDRELRRGPVVLRYTEDDGLPGIEGGMQICTFWLVEALWVIGEHARARSLFDDAAALAGPTGLLAEQFEPDLGISLGNFPQAYSHLGLINAACRLSDLPA